VSRTLSFSVLNRELPAEVRGNKLIKLRKLIIRNINNFIPDCWIELESDVNIKSYKIITFFEIICVEYQIPLINNLIVIGYKYLE
jgi:hypothetical protein